jgi:hypothetical protein
LPRQNFCSLVLTRLHKNRKELFPILFGACMVSSPCGSIRGTAWLALSQPVILDGGHPYDAAHLMQP